MDVAGRYLGGRCEIRTHEDLATLPVFKTGAFNRSANLPFRHAIGTSGLYHVLSVACEKPAT